MVCWWVLVRCNVKRRLFHRNPKCGLFGPFGKLGCNFFCFWLILWKGRRVSGPTHTTLCCWNSNLLNFLCSSAPPPSCPPPPPFRPPHSEGERKVDLWLCYISLFVGHNIKHYHIVPFFHLSFFPTKISSPWAMNMEHGRGGVLPSFARLLLQLVWLSFTSGPLHTYIFFFH